MSSKVKAMPEQKQAAIAFFLIPAFLFLGIVFWDVFQKWRLRTFGETHEAIVVREWTERDSDDSTNHVEIALFDGRTLELLAPAAAASSTQTPDSAPRLEGDAKKRVDDLMSKLSTEIGLINGTIKFHVPDDAPRYRHHRFSDALSSDLYPGKRVKVWITPADHERVLFEAERRELVFLSPGFVVGCIFLLISVSIWKFWHPAAKA